MYYTILKRVGLGLSLLFLILSINCTDKLIQNEEIENSIVGSWMLTEIQYIYSDTTYIAKEIQEGRFIFTSNRYALQYNPEMRPRAPFYNLSNPTNQEIIKAFRSVVFNTGSYKNNDSLLQTLADFAKVPGFEGGKQFYRVKYHTRDSMALTMFDETYPNGDKPAWYNKLSIKFILNRK
jgi:hypothetical protein